MPPVRVLSVPFVPTTTVAPAPTVPSPTTTTVRPTTTVAPAIPAPATTVPAPRVVPSTTTAPVTTAPATTTPPVVATPTAVLNSAIHRYVPAPDLAYLARVGWTWTIGTRGCPARVSLGCTWSTGPPSSQFSPGLVAAGSDWVGWIVTHEVGNALLLSTLHAPVSSWAGAGGWAAQFAATPTARGAPYSPYDAAAGCMTRAWGAPMESPRDTPIPCPAATATWVAAQVAQATTTGK